MLILCVAERSHGRRIHPDVYQSGRPLDVDVVRVFECCHGACAVHLLLWIGCVGEEEEQKCDEFRVERIGLECM